MNFSELHCPGQPLLLYNIWDPGSARKVAEAGASALATSSAAVAEALGLEDGEQLPRSELIDAVRRILRVVQVPLSVDIEFGFGDAAATALKMAEVGAVGCNIEDRAPGEIELRASEEQAGRLSEMKAALTAAGHHDFFLNARTDVFLRDSEASLGEAIERARVYREAGADGFFVPGLLEPERVSELCAAVALPVNVMSASPKNIPRLAEAGVSRVSFGPFPYRAAMSAFAAPIEALYNAAR